MQTYNSNYIRTLYPCESGILNFEKHYPRFDDKLSKLLALKKIPYGDKIWLASKVAPISVIKMWSVLCAETQLHNFEKQFPNDTRIRDCIDTIKNIKDLSNPTQSEKNNLSAAESAARSAANAGWSAASAANAAESAANAARSAAESAARSAANAARSAAESAARSAANAANAAEKKQKELNIKILIKLLKEKGL